MATVSISFNGRDYRVACDDGQESRLMKLGGMLEERGGELKDSLGGHVSHDLLLLMTSLLIADELTEAGAELDTVRGTQGANVQAAEDQRRAEERVAKAIESVAIRVDHIAQTLEAS
ncbi:MAG: cell division protein ZapA [Rhodospirillaceae bacterium]